MFIKEIVNQHRRDFNAIYECDHCGWTVTRSGYDDDNFHTNVVPTFKCGECGQTAKDSYRALKPKYPEGFQV